MFDAKKERLSFGKFFARWISICEDFSAREYSRGAYIDAEVRKTTGLVRLKPIILGEVDKI